jgi:hypothetical protein
MIENCMEDGPVSCAIGHERRVNIETTQPSRSNL